MPSSDIVRAPLLAVLADGSPVPGAIGARISTLGGYGCGHFAVQAALSADPLRGAAFWADAGSVLIEVQVSAGFDLASLITGTLDTVTVDPIANVVTLAGRDLAAGLIEARTRETFANQTSSEIATLLAGRHGLAAQVQATSTPVGRYWQLEHDRITLDQFSRATTEWDLLAGLADREGFDVWVAGGTLFFQPYATALDPNAILRPVGTLNGPANVERLSMERSLTFAGDVTVTVRSWNSRMGQGFTQQASTASSASGAAAARQYSFVMPNLTPDVALQIAQTRLDELTRHERVISAVMPGDTVLDAHAPLAIEGTGTAFDQVYRIDELVRSLDARRGFRQTVRAHNVSLGAGAF